MSQTTKFFSDSRYQNNPLAAVTEFLVLEDRLEQAGDIDRMRFVGYVLELGYDQATIITSDPYKRAVGGIPRGSFLIMAPTRNGDEPPHFTLLRVNSVAPTPLSMQVQQTYFELHKKSMPELDVFTQAELQWGALNCSVLGMFYPNPDDATKVAFSGDVNNVVSAHRYKVYAPNDEILLLVVNGLVRPEDRFSIGILRTTECQLPLNQAQAPAVKVEISAFDFKSTRTAMFGKTRLGKSNTVKLIAKSIIEAAKVKGGSKVGQLIFDINGEYANDNPQDRSRSIRTAYKEHCIVYALVERKKTPSKPLKLNFYEQPESCLLVLKDLLEQANSDATYIRAFASVELPTIALIPGKKEVSEQIRDVRQIQMWWAILYRAGFRFDEDKLRELKLKARGGVAYDFNPGFTDEVRKDAWGAASSVPEPPSTLEGLARELEAIANRMHSHEDTSWPKSSSGGELFRADDKALLNFLRPKSGSGPVAIQSFRNYHDPYASDVVIEIIGELDNGKTVILDLGSAPDKIRRYFSDMICRAVFKRQEDKFTSDELKNHYVQLYFEEAHNLFPRDAKSLTDVYSRFAKEGAKFHIGMVYSTQSPSTISQELLAQTENFFVGHLSSQDETKALGRVQVQYEGLQEEILRSRTPGYMRMLTQSHRYVIPVQIDLFEPASEEQP